MERTMDADDRASRVSLRIKALAAECHVRRRSSLLIEASQTEAVGE